MLTISSPALTAGSQRMGTVVSLLHGWTGGTSLVSTLVWDESVSRARYGRPARGGGFRPSGAAPLAAPPTSTPGLADDAADAPDVPSAPLLSWELARPSVAAEPTESTSTLGNTMRVWAEP